MSTSTEPHSTVVDTGIKLSERLEQHGIDYTDVVSIEVLTTTDGTPHTDLKLFVRVITYARDPLGQRYQLLDVDVEPRMATETRLIPLASLLG